MIILVERTTVTADIAVFLNISPHTTNHHLQRIFEKMNAVSKADVLHRFIHYAAKDIPGLRASV
jgi:DNA-binding NarL/FixJ family response regulator